MLSSVAKSLSHSVPDAKELQANTSMVATIFHPVSPQTSKAQLANAQPRARRRVQFLCCVRNSLPHPHPPPVFPAILLNVAALMEHLKAPF